MSNTEIFLFVESSTKFLSLVLLEKETANGKQKKLMLCSSKFVAASTVSLSILFLFSCAPKRDYVPLVKVDDRGALSQPTPPPAPAPDAPPVTDAQTQVTIQTLNTPSQSTNQTDIGNSRQSTPPTSVTQAPRFPWGRKIAGRPGFVLSPYAPNQGIVDVTDPATGQPYPRGTEVQCPFTNRIFLVP